MQLPTLFAAVLFCSVSFQSCSSSDTIDDSSLSRGVRSIVEDNESHPVAFTETMLGGHSLMKRQADDDADDGTGDRSGGDRKKRKRKQNKKTTPKPSKKKKNDSDGKEDKDDKDKDDKDDKGKDGDDKTTSKPRAGQDSSDSSPCEPDKYGNRWCGKRFKKLKPKLENSMNVLTAAMRDFHHYMGQLGPSEWYFIRTLEPSRELFYYYGRVLPELLGYSCHRMSAPMWTTNDMGESEFERKGGRGRRNDRFARDNVELGPVKPAPFSHIGRRGCSTLYCLDCWDRPAGFKQPSGFH